MAGFNADAVLFGRDFKVFTTPWATANTIPANTVLYGTDWATPAGQALPWSEVGYTDGGINFGIEITRGEIRVDQSLDPIGRPATGRNMTLTTAMAEFTPQNIYNAGGRQGTLNTVAATNVNRGYNDLDIGPDIVDLYLSVGYDIKHPGDQEAFRIIGWKTLPSGGISGAVTPEDNATIQLAVQCLPDTSTNPDRILKIRDMIAIGA
jgi:hypothetical protein